MANEGNEARFRWKWLIWNKRLENPPTPSPFIQRPGLYEAEWEKRLSRPATSTGNPVIPKQTHTQCRWKAIHAISLELLPRAQTIDALEVEGLVNGEQRAPYLAQTRRLGLSSPSVN